MRCYDNEIEILKQSLSEHNTYCTLSKLVKIYDGYIVEENQELQTVNVVINDTEKQIFWNEENSGLEVFNMNGIFLVKTQSFLDYFGISYHKATELETNYAKIHFQWNYVINNILLGIMAIFFQMTRGVLLYNESILVRRLVLLATAVMDLLFILVAADKDFYMAIIIALLSVIFFVQDIRYNYNNKINV